MWAWFLTINLLQEGFYSIWIFHERHSKAKRMESSSENPLLELSEEGQGKKPHNAQILL